MAWLLTLKCKLLYTFDILYFFPFNFNEAIVANMLVNIPFRVRLRSSPPLKT